MTFWMIRITWWIITIISYAFHIKNAHTHVRAFFNIYPNGYLPSEALRSATKIIEPNVCVIDAQRM